MSIRNFTKAVALSALLASSGAFAGDTWYIGFSVGEAESDLSFSESDVVSALADGSNLSASIDDSDTSYQFVIGHQFSEYFALEGGYLDLGEITVSASSDGSGSTLPAGTAKVTGEADGFTFGAKGILPITKNFSVYGKAGAFRWESDLDGKFSSAGLSGSGSIGSDHGVDAFYGAGISYALDQIILSADYTQYQDVGDETDVDVLAFNLLLFF